MSFFNASKPSGALHRWVGFFIIASGLAACLGIGVVAALYVEAFRVAEHYLHAPQG